MANSKNAKEDERIFNKYVTELFGDKKYGDYYLRGKSLKLSVPLFQFNINKTIAQSNYKTSILCLVHEGYFDSEKSENHLLVDPFHFKGRTEKECKDITKSYLTEYKKSFINYRPSKDNLTKFINSNLPNMEKIKLNPALLKANGVSKDMRDKKDVILIDVKTETLGAEQFKIKGSLLKSIPEHYSRIHYYLGSTFSDIHKIAIDSPLEFNPQNMTVNLYNWIKSLSEYKGITVNRFVKELRTIANFSYRLSYNKQIDNKFFNELNNYQDKTYKEKDLLLLYCYSFFDDLLDDMKERKILDVCQHHTCKRLFPFNPDRPNKKYCSETCNKKAVQSRLYKKKTSK